MKKTLISLTVMLAMGATAPLMAQDDALNGDINGSDQKSGVFTEGALSGITSDQENSNNAVTHDSFNAVIDNGFNDVNAHNSSAVGEDAIIASANDLNQAVASSDMNDTISDNKVSIDGGFSEGALSPVLNVNKFTRTDANSLNSAFNNYGGVASAQQNIGSASSVTQAIVVQSNGSI
ncbi:MAG TPA: hypothetical protein ENK26_01740 [Gammaproteobacteria bacterium]|nr:hypothetical protein [Gammaproteobacteria bacterium]